MSRSYVIRGPHAPHCDWDHARHRADNGCTRTWSRFCLSCVVWRVCRWNPGAFTRIWAQSGVLTHSNMQMRMENNSRSKCYTFELWGFHKSNGIGLNIQMKRTRHTMNCFVFTEHQEYEAITSFTHMRHRIMLFLTVLVIHCKMHIADYQFNCLILYNLW